VAKPASAEQVCSVQYPSGTPQMLGQRLGPDPPDNGTSTLPASTQKYSQFKSFRCHVQLLWGCGLLGYDNALSYHNFQETCCLLLQDVHSSTALQSPIIPRSVMPTRTMPKHPTAMKTSISHTQIFKFSRMLQPCWMINRDISKEHASLLGLLDSEDESTMHLWNGGNYQLLDMAEQPMRIKSSLTCYWEPKSLH